jgi:hypothetical protein
MAPGDAHPYLAPFDLVTEGNPGFPRRAGKMEYILSGCSFPEAYKIIPE